MRAASLVALGAAVVAVPVSSAAADGRCGSSACVADVGMFGHAEPQPIHLGDTSQYKFTAQNNGPNGALNIEVQATIPTGLQIISATPYGGRSCSVSGTFVDCFMGDFAAEQLGVVVVKVRGVKVGTWVAPAKVYASDVSDPNGGNNQVSATLGVTPKASGGSTTHRRASRHRRRRHRRRRR